ncbi:MAG: SseB family protein [Lachnospiraceae bacterium]|nr:SseB family protein [Lachnospiraceae bacterium]
MIMGVLAVVQQSGDGEVIVSGKIQGSVKEGDAVYIVNRGDNTSTIFGMVSSVTGGEESAGSLAAIGIQNGAFYNMKPGTVIYTGSYSQEEIHDTYARALGDVYVGLQQLELTDKDIERLSLSDLVEIWNLFLIWIQSGAGSAMDEIRRELYKQRQVVLVQEICKKLMVEKEVYCVYSKATRQPYMYSRTVRQEQRCMCTPPHIWLFTKSVFDFIIPTLSKDIYGVMPIKSGEDGTGIYRFLSDVIRLNGVNEVAIQSHHCCIPNWMLVPELDDSEVQNQSMTNPDVVRWILLMGQMESINSEDEILSYNLYHDFMLKALKEAKLLIPVQYDNESVQGETQVNIVSMSGKGERRAVRLFTDWREFRMAFGEEWDGMAVSLADMIGTYDCIINAGTNANAGCYIDQDMYES